MRFTLTAITILISTILCSQAPALIPYQAIARNAAGEPLASSALNARFTMHDGAASGTVVWQELQTVSTSALGLFSAQLGSNVPLTSVNWANGDKFMQVEIDLGNGFVDIGTQQLLSVPYALHAGSVHLDVSMTGDTLFVGDGSYVIIPGISEANDDSHSPCVALNFLNPIASYNVLQDLDGNMYKSIIIGGQEWMAENLRTATYNNGDPIPTNLDSAAWNNSTYGAWTIYDNLNSNECQNGKLYNWFACADSRGLCPVGWRVPSENDWLDLINFLGGDSIAGGKLKSIGTLESGDGLWVYPNAGATNSSGFSAIPSGYINSLSSFGNLNYNAFYWTATEYFPNSSSAWMSLLYNFTDLVSMIQTFNKQYGLSVRCIKD